MRSRNYVFPTQAERERERRARKLGCVLSRIRQEKGLPVPKGRVEIDHLVNPGKRLGHGFSIPLNIWYHRSAVVPYPCESKAQARELFGASVAHGSKAFLADHGVTRMDLYVKTQELLGLPVESVPTKIVPRRVA